MYPIGIRVIKVRAPDLGMTGTVCNPFKGRHPRDDLSVAYDGATLHRGVMLPAGTVYSCNSANWRPINPDADDETNVEDKELEEVL